MKVWEALPLCRAGSGTSKGRGKEGGSQQFRGSEAASRGRQMGEQVLHLPSRNSAEQSCHQTLKGVIKAAAQLISGHCIGAFLLPQSQQSAWPSLTVGVPLLLGQLEPFGTHPGCLPCLVANLLAAGPEQQHYHTVGRGLHPRL